ncbi:MAG: carbohydrate ABC transporter permease [Phototrophicaceae bacterium]
MENIGYLVNPWLTVAIASLVGSITLLGLRWQLGRGNWLVIGLVGAFAAGLGSTLLTAPLGYCMFQEGQKTADMVMGWILVGLGAGLFILVSWILMSRWVQRLPLFPRAEHVAGAFHGRFAFLNALLVLSPTLLVLIFFVYIPMFDTLRLSTLLAKFGTPRTRFVCVANFSTLLTDSGYHMNLILSFAFSGGIILLAMSSALLIATMLNQNIRGANIYRSLLIWPYAISPVVTGAIFRLLFGQESGLINYGLDSLFGMKVAWLTTVNPARFSVIMASVWNIIGFNILFYIAGLQNIPKDVIEAAAIDGANAFQRFWRVTFPLLSPFTFFLVVTNTVYAFFDTFGLIFVLTRGGPTESTFTAMFRVYVTGILGNDIGKATAQSLVLFLIVVIITIVQFRIGNRTVQYGNY